MGLANCANCWDSPCTCSGWYIVGTEEYKSLPRYDRAVYAVVQNDIVNEKEEPLVVKLKRVRNGEGANPTFSWHLLEFDPNEQEELLQQKYSVVLWKYIT